MFTRVPLARDAEKSAEAPGTFSAFFEREMSIRKCRALGATVVRCGRFANDVPSRRGVEDTFAAVWNARIDASVIHYRARSLYFVRNVLSIHSWSGLLGLVRMGHLSVKLHLRYFAYRMDYQRVPVARVDQLFESESYER